MKIMKRLFLIHSEETISFPEKYGILKTFMGKILLGILKSHINYLLSILKLVTLAGGHPPTYLTLKLFQ